MVQGLNGPSRSSRNKGDREGLLLKIRKLGCGLSVGMSG